MNYRNSFKKNKLNTNRKNNNFFNGLNFSFFKRHKAQLSSKKLNLNSNSFNVNNQGIEITNKTKSKTKFFYTKKPIKTVDKSKIRVFKPDDKKIIAEKIKNTIPVSNKKEKGKQFLFGFKNFSNWNKKLKGKDFLTSFNLILVQSRLKEKLNNLISYSIVFILTIFLIYLSFFDTNFLVKEYEIFFVDSKSPEGFKYTSFLSDKEIKKVLNTFNQERAFGIIPHNQYWFVNDISLTLAARHAVSDIQEVRIKKRIWPNKLVLEIKTEPILATLGIYERNQKKYWRINQRGEVFTQDTASILENLISVSSPVTLTSQNASGSIEQITLQDYDLQNSHIQLNRLWFANWLWGQLKAQEIDILDTNFPTLLDTNVIITTRNNTKMYFDSDIQKVPREVLTARIEQIFRSQINQELRENKIAYMDFRLETKRVVVCYRGNQCETRLNNNILN
jgi:hypothetical protein